MTIARAQMNRQLYGVGSLVEREKYGLGSALKKFAKTFIPKELDPILQVAAPFLGPVYGPIASVAGSARTGKINPYSLAASTLPYVQFGGVQGATGLQSLMPTGYGGSGALGQFLPGGNLQIGSGTNLASKLSEFMKVSPSDSTTGRPPLLSGQDYDMLSGQGINTQGTTSSLGDLKTLFSPDSNVGLATRGQAAINLTGDALKAMYKNPDGSYDKRAIVATISAIPSYLDAKKKADEVGLSANEFNEQIYNEQKQGFQNRYTSNAPASSFMRTTAQMGGIMNGLQQQQEEPIFPRLETLSENLGQAEQTLGQPSNQSNNSPMTSLMMGPQGFAEGGLLSIQLTPVQKMAMGGEIPVRKNQGGVTELDLRAKGGYIPVGIKEKADDVPAMLSKNEFVFTADAVRGAGDGSINKGAQKMYKLMKSLEKKVKKTKVA
jgi:hypothetical protein